ncbi:MAG: hypothetical protein QNL91_13275 [Candidatus Krumholzibacteria bacterium]|nr:hypothetical protein [Candidatus Krumholzibacteria bacterium]
MNSVRAARAALAGFFVLLGLAAPGQLWAWSEFGEPEEKPALATEGPEIREPFFAFLLGMVAADSLGQWTGAELRAAAEDVGRPSRFPLDQVVSLSRSRPDSVGARRYIGARVQANWRIVLAEDQDRPMPYSIMGYHPGSLLIGGELVLAELAAIDLDLAWGGGEDRQSETVTEVRVFVLEKGHVALDADGWLDALLGASLDDSWTVGFVTGREQGRLLGLGVSLGRKGRHIYGEFDFANDEVLTHGRELASALSRMSRSWLSTENGNLPVPWSER